MVFLSKVRKWVVLSIALLFLNSLAQGEIRWNMTVLSQIPSQARAAWRDFQFGKAYDGTPYASAWNSYPEAWWPIESPLGGSTTLWAANDLACVGQRSISAGVFHASLWAGDSFVDLHPSGYTSSAAYGLDGPIQVGTVFETASPNGFAACWSGTPESVQVLHPLGYISSRANSGGNGKIVGHVVPSGGRFHAGLWDTATGVFTDLTPNSHTANAMAVDGNHQYGYNVVAQGDRPVACRWAGTSDSLEYLSPRDAHESQIWFAHRGFAAGNWIPSPTTGWRKAGLWNTTNNTFLDLHSLFGPHSGYLGSEAWGVYVDDEGRNIWIAGFVWVRVGSSNTYRAMVWHGTTNGTGLIYEELESDLRKTTAVTSSHLVTLR